MRYRIGNVKLSLEKFAKSENFIKTLENKVSREAKIKIDDIRDLEIIKESVDARRKNNILLVYTLDFSCEKKLNLPLSKKAEYVIEKIENHKDLPPVVVGFGPCGIFAALILAEAGLKPIVLERGKEVYQRYKDVNQFWQKGYENPDVFNSESNVQFGEGGAGTFSDGKLTTGIKDNRISKVLLEFVEAGADREILYKQKPHIGTDRLVEIVANMREKIIKLGGEVRFQSFVSDFIIDENKNLKGLKIVENRGLENENVYDIFCDKAVLAIGHSSRETFKRCNEVGFFMSQKPFSVGLRVEHPQEIIDKSQYGKKEVASILGEASYKLNTRADDGRGVYTFCMCPGGSVVLSSSGKGQVLSNGMSNSKRNSGFANSAVLVDIRPSDFESDDVLAGMRFQEKIEKGAFNLAGGYRLLETTLKDFKDSKLAASLPDFVSKDIDGAMTDFGKKIKGFDNDNTKMLGPETRSSSPVRFFRNENFESNIGGVFPGGEGAGYAGGIMSAAVDGIRLAEGIIRNW